MAGMKPTKMRACAKCRAGYPRRLYPYEEGFVCAGCMKRFTEGRDATTKAARYEQSGLSFRAEAVRLRERGDTDVATAYEKIATESQSKAQKVTAPTPTQTSLGEVVPSKKSWLRETLQELVVSLRWMQAHTAPSS